ncbi:hypothetical protein ABKN59_010156 [Abortiporus biennis]
MNSQLCKFINYNYIGLNGRPFHPIISTFGHHVSHAVKEQAQIVDNDKKYSATSGRFSVSPKLLTGVRKRFDPTGASTWRPIAKASLLLFSPPKRGFAIVGAAFWPIAHRSGFAGGPLIMEKERSALYNFVIGSESFRRTNVVFPPQPKRSYKFSGVFELAFQLCPKPHKLKRRVFTFLPEDPGIGMHVERVHALITVTDINLVISVEVKMTPMVQINEIIHVTKVKRAGFSVHTGATILYMVHLTRYLGTLNEETSGSTIPITGLQCQAARPDYIYICRLMVRVMQQRDSQPLQRAE